MEYAGVETLPIREKNDMCPNIAIHTLNRKGYLIPYVAENYPLRELKSTINSYLAAKGLSLRTYTGATSAILNLLVRRTDGFLVLENSRTGGAHVIAFIFVNNTLFFYDAEKGQLNIYKCLVQETPNAELFSRTFVKYFPQYSILESNLIQRVVGGRRKTRKRKTRKHRR